MLVAQERPSHQACLRTVFVAAILLLPSHLEAFDPTAVNDVIARAQVCRSATCPALAISVVKDGATLLSRGYGVTRHHGNRKVTGSTRFVVASLSKAFTATLLLKVMAEDGRYNLSTKLRDIIGDNFRFADDFRTKEATVEDILSHKMALPGHNKMRFDETLNLNKLVDRLRYFNSSKGFRNTFIYNNLMYGLAAHLTETIADEGWESLVKRILFQPLGMARSTFARELNSGTLDSNVAQGRDAYNGTLRPLHSRFHSLWAKLKGSGNIVSTADDMTRWMNFHLTKGKNQQGEQVVAEELMAELHKPRMNIGGNYMKLFQQPTVPVTFSVDIYAMGWRTGYYRGYPIVTHNGDVSGYHSLLTLVPSLKAAVFTSMAGSDPDFAFRGSLHAFVIDQLLGVPSWLNESTLCSFPAPWHITTPKPLPSFGAKIPLRHPPSVYLGRYDNPAYGQLVVRPWERGVGDTEGESREPSAHFILSYGFGVWDLVKVTHPSYVFSFSSISSYGRTSSFPQEAQAGTESFYGKGRGITAWMDLSPFVFQFSYKGSDVIANLSIPGFDPLFTPPVFTRTGSASSGGGRTRVSYWFFGVLLTVTAICLVFRMRRLFSTGRKKARLL